MGGMGAADLWVTGFVLLGVWDVYATVQSLRHASRRTWKWWRLVLVGVLLTGTCTLCAASLWSNRFRAWMIAPVGASYLLMLPMPCYFGWVDRTRWVHGLRNLLFVVIAAGCFAVAAGIVPLSWLGL